jgi:hypothetical protein
MTANRNNNGVIWGGLLIGLGALFLLSELIPGLGRLVWGAIWTAGFAFGGLALYLFYTRNRQHWWALIPAYILMTIAALIALGTLRVSGEWIAAFVLYAIGFPFLYVYLRDHRHWWALIPAYVMAAVGTFPLLLWFNNHILDLINGFGIAAYWQFAIALPFFVVYLRNHEHWWALIPGGLFAFMGVIFAAVGTWWLIPAAMIIGGAYLVVRQLGNSRQERRAEPAPAAIPTHGPEADRPLTTFEPIGSRTEEKDRERV